MSRPRRRIVLGVTSTMSLRLMRGFPEYLVERGWDVHVVASGDLPEPSSGVTYHQLTMHREPHPWRDLRGLIAWIRLLAHIKPDVVSTGTPKAGLLGMVAALLTRRPVRIYKLRGLRMETSIGSQRRILMAVEWLTMASSQTIISVSPSLRQRAIELRLAPKQKLVVLGAGSSNGVDLDRFDPTGARYDSSREALGVAGRTPVIGFIGRLGVDKGVLELLDAAADLKRRGREFMLLLVGTSEDEACELAVTEARAEGVPIQRRDFIEDPGDVFHAIDILCLPTHREGFPNVVLEASASATPVVTTDATGAVDSVIHAHTGLIARAGDSASIADALEQLLDNSELRSRYGANGREHVDANYRSSEVWAKEAALYESALHRHS